MNKRKYLEHYFLTILAAGFILAVIIVAVNVNAIQNSISEKEESIFVLSDIKSNFSSYLVNPRKIDIIDAQQYFNALNSEAIKTTVSVEFWNELKLFLINFNYNIPKKEIAAELEIIDAEIKGIRSAMHIDYSRLQVRWTIILMLSIFGCFFAVATLILALTYRSQKEKLRVKSEDLRMTKAEAENAVQAKSEFLNVMSHEIRTPLNAVIGLSHILAQSNPTEAQQKHLELLQFSSENLLILINDILDFGKIEAGKVELEEKAFDISKHLRKIISSLEPFARSKNLKLRFDIHNATYNNVIGDPTRLGQIIFNVANNAIKFTQSGSVQLSLTGITETPTEVSYEIAIKDTGIGIPEEKRKIIFEHFSQANSNTSRRYGGSGLGLTISQKLLHLMGSKLQLESKPNQGSLFWFNVTFSKADSSLIEKESREKQLHTMSQDAKILVVEDNRINLLILEKLLADIGLTCETASNGEEAVSKAIDTRYDLILMDLQMPIMDGFKASKKIRDHLGKDKPMIVAISAANENTLKSKLIDAGIEDYILKPIDVDLFHAKLSSFIRVK